MISTQRATGQLVRGDPRAHAVVQDLRGRARSRTEPALEQVVEDRLRRPAGALAHEMHLHRRVGVQVDPRRDLLHEPQPAPVVLERVVRMDAALHADLRGAVLDRLANPGLEVLLGDVVGIGRAATLSEAAEGAADHAHVREVDVAIDHEGHPVAGELRPQLVGSRAHLLDHLRTSLREQRAGLVLGERLAPAPLVDRPRGDVRLDPALAAPPRSLARDEAPVLELHDVEHPLLDPGRVEVLRIGAEPLGERKAPRLKALPHLMRARERVLGRDVVAVRRQAAEVGGPLLHELVPPVGEVRGNLDPHLGHEPAALADQKLHVIQRHRRGPVG